MKRERVFRERADVFVPWLAYQTFQKLSSELGVVLVCQVTHLHIPFPPHWASRRHSLTTTLGFSTTFPYHRTELLDDIPFPPHWASWRYSLTTTLSFLTTGAFQRKLADRFGWRGIICMSAGVYSSDMMWLTRLTLKLKLQWELQCNWSDWLHTHEGVGVVGRIWLC